MTQKHGVISHPQNGSKDGFLLLTTNMWVVGGGERQPVKALSASQKQVRNACQHAPAEIEFYLNI